MATAYRPNNADYRRPAPKKKRKKKVRGRFFAFVLVVLVAVLAIILVPKLTSREAQQPAPTAAPSAMSSADLSKLSALLGDSEAKVDPLAESERVNVADLSIKSGLPTEWKNVLLLGSDGHDSVNSARTDTMMVCSINTKTGEVRLCSIMRDMMVEIPGKGSYKINSANFWGGPQLAMKIVNECFGLNIEKYVSVNFFGFQQIAELLGGIDMDITESEMNEINKNVSEQIRLGREAGVDESDLPAVILQTYGQNTHLDGRQTLGYARIRKLDGGDYARTTRQRTVLTAIMKKVMGKSALEITSIAAKITPYFASNMTLNEMLNFAMTVLSSGNTNVKQTYLPAQGTFKNETRKEIWAMYDVDYATNAQLMYTFIYE